MLIFWWLISCMRCLSALSRFCSLCTDVFLSGGHTGRVFSIHRILHFLYSIAYVFMILDVFLCWNRPRKINGRMCRLRTVLSSSIRTLWNIKVEIVFRLRNVEPHIGLSHSGIHETSAIHLSGWIRKPWVSHHRFGGMTMTLISGSPIRCSANKPIQLWSQLLLFLFGVRKPILLLSALLSSLNPS